MANWMHTYRPGQIPPQGVINETTPGRQIAESITEIHNKALTDIELALSGGLSGDVTLEGNTATISLDAPEQQAGSGLPPGGLPFQVLQRDSSGNAVWDWVRAVSP